MHYYTFSAIVFKDGQIRDAYNIMHQSEKPSTVIEFKRRVEGHYAGAPDTYNAIIIPVWQELDKETYDYMSSEMGKDNDKREQS